MIIAASCADVMVVVDQLVWFGRLCRDDLGWVEVLALRASTGWDEDDGSSDGSLAINGSLGHYSGEKGERTVSV